MRNKWNDLEDIQSREDIDKVVRSFYELLLADEIMRPIFVDIARLDLEKHFPHLIDFWHSILFYTGAYRKNVMEIHIDLNKKVTLKPEHYRLWTMYFEQAVRDSFYGPRSDLAVERARSIAQLMEFKISELTGPSESPSE